MRATSVGGGDYAGETIRNVGWLWPDDAYGNVFIKNLDTTNSIRGNGLFTTGPGFSLKQKSKFKATQGGVEILRSENGTWVGIAAMSQHLRLYEDSLDFAAKKGYVLASKNRNQVLGDRWSRALVPGSEAEGLIALKNLTDQGTLISYWSPDNLRFRGDTVFNSLPAILASVDYYVPDRFAGGATSYSDIDRDGYPDLLFSSTWSMLTVCFGKADGSLWAIDTIVTSQGEPGFIVMDFLRNDGILDLIMRQNDTIYCFDGSRDRFLRTSLDYDKADLKIPAPHKLDPTFFTNFGIGHFSDWGYSLFDAGDIAGNGSHALATTGVLFPSSGGLFYMSYLMLYTGGKAADERMDAIYSDNDGQSDFGLGIDTIRTSPDGPSELLTGQFYGRGGRINRYKGSYDIPHKADIRWSGISQVRSLEQADFRLRALGRDAIEVTAGTSRRWRIAIRDLLGRTVLERTIQEGEPSTIIGVRSLAPGLYSIEVVSGGLLHSQRMMIGSNAIAASRRMLPSHDFPPFELSAEPYIVRERFNRPND